MEQSDRIAVDLPSLVYTRGTRGDNHKQMLQNEVVWCDVAARLQGGS